MTHNPLREELIQIAAVAIAIIQDIDNGSTDLGDVMQHYRLVEGDVAYERIQQEAKWGTQHHTIPEWLMILGEEYGEACQAAVDSYEWGDGS